VINQPSASTSSATGNSSAQKVGVIKNLLKIENAKFDYALAALPDSKAIHPDSPLGVKMNLLVLPLFLGQDIPSEGLIILTVDFQNKLTDIF